MVHREAVLAMATAVLVGAGVGDVVATSIAAPAEAAPVSTAAATTSPAGLVLRAQRHPKRAARHTPVVAAAPPAGTTTPLAEPAAFVPKSRHRGRRARTLQGAVAVHHGRHAGGGHRRDARGVV